MKRFFLGGLVALCIAVPSWGACINVQAGDWDDCGVHRRPGSEPGSWCGDAMGSGGGSHGSSWRLVNIEERFAKVKASLEHFFAKPTYGD
jgi:hypothetical protein